MSPLQKYMLINNMPAQGPMLAKRDSQGNTVEPAPQAPQTPDSGYSDPDFGKGDGDDRRRGAAKKISDSYGGTY